MQQSGPQWSHEDNRLKDNHLKEAVYQGYVARSGTFDSATQVSLACPKEQLAWYVNDTLPPQQREAITEHLRYCADCRYEVEQWSRTKTAIQLADAEQPLLRTMLFSAIEQRLDTNTPTARVRAIVTRAWQNLLVRTRYYSEILWTQARQIRVDLLWSPLLLLLISPSLIMLGYHIHTLSSLLNLQAFLSALLIALGMAFLYGQEIDPAYEMIQATPTEPALLLLLRGSIVFSYNVLINLLALLPLLLTHPGGLQLTPQWILGNWLAPLCCLAAISLLLSIVLNARVALCVCLLLWGLRALTLFSFNISLSSFLYSYGQFWQQTPLLFGIAAIAVILTFIAVERKERIVVL
jgi:hypothetical protein